MVKRFISALIALLMSLTGISATPEAKCSAAFNGTFIQGWLCADWSDETWQKEIRYMKEAGIEYLILQDLVCISSAHSGTLCYPSELDSLGSLELCGDILGDALRNCKGSGIKVFVGLVSYDNWWSSAGLSSEYSDICNLSANVLEEIYSRYYTGYEDTFYGWYYTPEISNNPLMKMSILNIADGFNIIIDKANELNSAMPVLLSPYYSDYLAVPSVLAALPEWTLFMNRAHLRDGDIFAPQDAVGAGWIDISRAESVWQMYSAAVSACKADIELWANCENMTCANSGGVFMPKKTIEKENATSSLDKFVEQMSIASHYVDNIITFSYNHYYSPNTVNPVYHNTYLDYLKNGKLETQAPSEPTDVKIENGLLTWNASTDNIGIAYYIVSENGNPVARIESGSALQYEVTGGEIYTVTAVDGAGNTAVSY